jgi:hypothetical protein
VVRDRRYHRHGRLAGRGGQPEGRIPVRLAGNSSRGSGAHRRGQCRRGLPARAGPGGQREGREDGRTGSGSGPSGFAGSRAATPLSPRSPAAHPTSLAPPATRRAYSLPVTSALTARHTLALTDRTIAVTDLIPVITSPGVTITPVAYITRALTDITITNAYFTRARTDTHRTRTDNHRTLADTHLPITDTYANTHRSVTIAHLTITNAKLADTHLHITLGIALNPVWVTGTRRIAATDPGPAAWSPASYGRRERAAPPQLPNGVSGHRHGQSAGRLCPGDALVRLPCGRASGG